MVGAALGLNLLFGIPLFPAGLIAGAGAFAILGLQQMGFRRLEAGITALVGVVVAAFAFELFDAKPGRRAKSPSTSFVPGFAGTESILLATGIIGATVMPHVIYLHSALTQRRIVGRNDGRAQADPRASRRSTSSSRCRWPGLVNLSMMIIAAALFHASGLAGDRLDRRRLRRPQARWSPTDAATIFGIALLASGFASSSVGTMAGQVVMQGFIRRRIPIFVRRAITLAPALVVLGDRPRPDRRAGRQPGRPLLRHPLRAGAAADHRRATRR